MNKTNRFCRRFGIAASIAVLGLCVGCARSDVQNNAADSASETIRTDDVAEDRIDDVAADRIEDVAENAASADDDPSGWGQSASRTAGTVQTLTLDGIEYRFHWIPAGTFATNVFDVEDDGNLDDDLDDGEDWEDDGIDGDACYQVTLTRGFWILETETTQKMWTSVMGANPSAFADDDLPVQNVCWNDVQEFIAKLNSRNVLPAGLEFRLPTDAEWKYACRAGSDSAYSGSDNLDEVGWYGKNSGNQPHSVGQKKANAWGLFDMSGNVSEWVQDWFQSFPNGSAIDPQGPDSGTFRTICGGGWHDTEENCRRVKQSFLDPNASFNGLGFRFAAADSK